MHNGVANACVFVADITYLNLNVAFEIGLAIGKRKPIALIRNTSFNGNHGVNPAVGIYDTIGQDRYSNGPSLADVLKKASTRRPLVIDFPRNQGMPLFAVLPKAKDDFVMRLISRIKRTSLPFRTFDAGEQNVLNAGEAIQQVTESFGVVLSLLQSTHPECFVHNIRTMFVAGLSVGMQRPFVLLTTGVDAPPMDVVDIVKECRFPQQIDEAVRELTTDVQLALEKAVAKQKPEKTPLERLDLGASSAENELSTLDAYYLATDAFQRASRGEARLVVGRKGSGKSALFFQLRRTLLQTKQTLVVDLKPDGFQLITLKESLAPVLSSGSLEHVITAFWEYVLSCEIARQFLKDMSVLSRRDPEMMSAYDALERVFSDHSLSADGDFSERIVVSLKRIEQQVIELAAETSTGGSKVTLSFAGRDQARARRSPERDPGTAIRMLEVQGECLDPI